MAAKPDFTYTVTDDLYVIWPENPQAEQTVAKMIEQQGAHKLTGTEFAAFRQQARKAGYSVHKQKPLAGITGEELLAALEA